MINWDQVSTIADEAQTGLCNEPVVFLRFPDPESIPQQTPFTQPAVQPDPDEYEITAGVSVSNPKVELKTWGQELHADFKLFMTTRSFIAVTGLDVTDRDILDSIAKDGLRIRGAVCSILKSKLSGWTGETYLWLILAAAREAL